MAKKRTKKDKQQAHHRRLLSYTLPTDDTLTPKLASSILPKNELGFQLVKRDLFRTVLFSALIIGLELSLYLLTR